MDDASVAFVSMQTEFFGGGEQSLMVLIRGLEARGVSTRLVCPGPGELAYAARDAGAQVEFSPVPKLRGLGAWRAPEAARALERAVRGARIVHLNGTRPMLLAWLARLPQPLVWHIRQTAREPWLDRVLGGAATRIIAISKAVEERFAGLACTEKVRVVPNGVSLRAFSADREAAAARRALGLSVPDPWVVVAGRLHETKGQRYLIDAMESLPEAHLAIVGDGPERLDLLERADRFGKRIRFLGHRRDVAIAMSAADVVAVPSLVEPFGRVAIEAMAAGRPVVASRVGGLPEIVVEGETGRLVTPRSSEELAERIGELLSDPGRSQGMGRAGRARAEALYSLEAHAENVMAVYREFDSPAVPRSHREADSEFPCASL